MRVFLVVCIALMHLALNAPSEPAEALAARALQRRGTPAAPPVVDPELHSPSELLGGSQPPARCPETCTYFSILAPSLTIVLCWQVVGLSMQAMLCEHAQMVHSGEDSDRSAGSGSWFTSLFGRAAKDTAMDPQLRQPPQVRAVRYRRASWLKQSLYGSLDCRHLSSFLCHPSCVILPVCRRSRCRMQAATRSRCRWR